MADKDVADCISEVLDSGRTYTGLPVYWDTDRFYQAPGATPLPRLDNFGIKAALLDGVDFIGDKTQFFVNVTTEGDIIASSPCIKVAS